MNVQDQRREAFGLAAKGLNNGVFE